MAKTKKEHRESIEEPPSQKKRKKRKERHENIEDPPLHRKRKGKVVTVITVISLFFPAVTIDGENASPVNIEIDRINILSGNSINT
ncbi:hypothetical protein Tam10B_2437 [Bifidobacterium vansinderenii]|uniref:Uncharacterized protein n=2 Tax=Bifidobacterium vansinderenii TaxID=1984871 RepID=A0A229VUF0_9BIFI|nr:hypothetical protein Tam10B_2516 [Bifidobacterium vansinderenii]OXM99325.1 hypothetical protein Tam10B_2437 [Bifidobacterium vansinderenii]